MIKIKTSLFHKLFHQNTQDPEISVRMKIGTYELICNALQLAAQQGNEQFIGEFEDLFNQCSQSLNEVNCEIHKKTKKSSTRSIQKKVAEELSTMAQNLRKVKK